MILARQLLPFALVLGLSQGLAAQTVAVQTVRGEQIAACALSALVAKSGDMEGTLEWKPASVVADSQVPEGQYELRVGEVHGEWPRRRIGVPVQLWVDGRLAQSRVVWFSGHWWREALVYTRNAKAGQGANVSMAVLQKIDSAGIEILASSDMSWSEGLRLKRSVKAGEPVARTDFENAPMVSRDEHVKVVVNIGEVHLLTSGVAGEEGAIDDVIKVLPHGAEHSVKATVVARNEVRIER